MITQRNVLIMLLIRAPHRKPRDWLTTIQQLPVAREK